jgi:hypothetical protein
MRTFDWALFQLYNAGHIAYEEALRNADSANELRLNIKLKSERGEPWDVGPAGGLCLAGHLYEHVKRSASFLVNTMSHDTMQPSVPHDHCSSTHAGDFPRTCKR